MARTRLTPLFLSENFRFGSEKHEARGTVMVVTVTSDESFAALNLEVAAEGGDVK